MFERGLEKKNSSNIVLYFYFIRGKICYFDSNPNLGPYPFSQDMDPDQNQYDLNPKYWIITSYWTIEMNI